MPAKQTAKALSLLTEKLTERDFLTRSGQSAKRMRTLVASELSVAKLNALYPVTRRITCKEVLAFSKKLLRVLSAEPKEGWLKFTYDFACHILYPDDPFAKHAAPYKAGAYCFLAILQFFFDEERKVIEPEATVDFEFLTDSEASEFESRDEYARFKKTWRREYVYEMMRLNKEATSFNTLAHLAGVHFVAMHIARGLYDADVPVDMALVSAAAAEAPDNAVEMTRLMGNGINLGNTMEACNNGKTGGNRTDDPLYYETMWGQPVTTAENAAIWESR